MLITYGGELSRFEEELEVDDSLSEAQINRLVKELVRQRADYWFRKDEQHL